MKPLNYGLLNGPTPSSKVWNICYMNAVIQCLLPSPEIQSWITSTLLSSSSSEKGYQVAKYLQSLYKGEKAFADPRVLLNILKKEKDSFPIGSQNESYRFFLFFLDSINDEKLNSIFQVTQRLSIQCTKCGFTHYLNEKFDSSRLEYKNNTLFLDLKIGPSVTTLKEALDLNNQIEEVERKCSYDGKGACQNGKTNVIAHKASRLIGPLHNVCILLERVEKKKEIKSKHALYILEKQPFTVFDTDPNKPKRETDKHLYGVVVHIGAKASSGHYISFAKHPFTRVWWKYNDTKVTLSTFTEVQSYNRQFVMLFYG